MKKFIAKTVFLGIIISGFIAIFWHLSTFIGTKYEGDTTASLIETSFRNAIANDYNCYFLGNSRIYRGINPDKFNQVNAYNFAHDNDTYNQMYYKLLYLLNHGQKIEYLVIGTDYFQFSFLSDTRNYIYSKLFPKEYGLDYASGWLETQEKYIFTQWNARKNVLANSLKYILQRGTPEKKNYQKENGQYIAYGTASPDDTANRDSTILDVQYKYYTEIINLCKMKSIKLYVVMPPARNSELSSYTQEEMEAFNRMIEESLGEQNKVNYYNCSQLEGFTDYSNYIDSTHLNKDAADRFSIVLNDMIWG